MPFNDFKYALVCNDIPNSLVNGLSLSQHEPVSLETARQQHKSYLNHFKESNVKLIEIEPNEAFPDSVFVEDIAIALEKRIFICNPGAESRRGEVDAVKYAFQKHAVELDLKILEIENKKDTFIDGGDCCFTGKEFLIGLSTRTNQKGVDELQKAFSDIPVTAISVREGLHLKSSMTMLCDNTILIGKSSASQFIKEQIKAKSKYADTYKYVEVEQDEHGAANVLYFNGCTLYPKSFESIYNQLNEFKELKSVKSLENSEFTKIDGCLTCRSILF